MATPNPPDSTPLADVYTNMRRLRGVGGRLTITIPSGSKTGDATVNLPAAFVEQLAKNPASVDPLDRYVVGTQVGTSLTGTTLLNKAASSFTIRVFRTNDVAAASATSVPVEWTAYPI